MKQHQLYKYHNEPDYLVLWRKNENLGSNERNLNDLDFLEANYEDNQNSGLQFAHCKSTVSTSTN